MLDIMKFARNEQTSIEPRIKVAGEITQTEIAADLIKWSFFYLYVPRGPMNSLEDAVIVGAIAGAVSQLVREQKDREIEEQLRASSKQNKKTSKTLKRKSVNQESKTNYQFKKLDKTSMDADAKAYRNMKTTSNSAKYTAVSSFNRDSPKFSENKVGEESSGWRMFIDMLQNMGSRTEEDMPQSPFLPANTILRPDFVLTRFARSSIECAVQLLTYEAAKRYVMEVAPYFQQAISLDVKDISELITFSV